MRADKTTGTDCGTGVDPTGTVTTRAQRRRRDHTRAKVVAFAALASLVVVAATFAPMLCAYDPKNTKRPRAAGGKGNAKGRLS